jgi:hypothetical protein
MVMDMAARDSAAAGQKPASQSPEEARMNLALGYAMNYLLFEVITDA